MWSHGHLTPPQTLNSAGGERQGKPQVTCTAWQVTYAPDGPVGTMSTWQESCKKDKQVIVHVDGQLADT